MESLTILLLVACSFADVLTVPSTGDELDEKLRQTKVEIAKFYFREEPPVPRKLYNVQWSELRRRNLTKERPFIENAFNGAVLVDGNRVVPIPVDESPSNRSSSQELASNRRNDSVTFVRSIVWKTVLYLMLCYESCTCSLYTGTDNFQLRHRQSVQHKGCPMDASFFVRANRLYLVMADNSGIFAVPSLIYHWRGTYMDVIAEAMTTAAVSVATFKHKQSTIIVFAQYDKNDPDIGSVVYEFKESGLDRIQFLPTLSPVSLHHYDHAGYNFVFLTNERGPSSLFWWDGHELLNWQPIPEIEGSSLVHVLNVHEDTFFFVGHQNGLRLYKFENASDCALISSKKLKDGETVIDACVKIDGSTLIAVLVTANEDNVHGLVTWQLQIQEIPSEHSTAETNALSKHLSELVELLQRRNLLVAKAEASWPSLLPASENLTIVEPLTVENLILESGSVGNIDVFVAGDFVAPRELEESLENLTGRVNDALKESKNLLTSNNTSSIKGDVTVEGDAFAGKLQIDSMDVDFLNDVDVRQNDAVESNETEEFSTPLRGKSILVRDLEVNSLCGIPFQYWAIENGTTRSGLNLETEGITFSNDTVHLRSNLSLTNLNVSMLNDVNVDEFLSELFIVGQNQRIEGNVTFKNIVEIQNLTMRMLNGEPWENYMNRRTDQRFDRFTAKSLRVENLYADTINGVPVSEAARVSRENVIKGNVKIANLQVTEKLTVDSDSPRPESGPLQIYHNVTIDGNARIKVLDLDKHTKIFLNDVEVDPNNFGDFWTKSSDQVIQNNVTFESNVTIDRLNATFLNGFSENEFLYTTVTTIPENFKRLHFENVSLPFFAGEENGFMDVAPESITIHEPLHLTRLRGGKLLVDTYNNLPVADILNKKSSFPENAEFYKIRAKRVKAEELDFLFLNSEDISFLQKAENGTKNRTENFMKIPELNVENLFAKRLNGFEMAKLASLKNLKMSDFQNLVIDGDLTVTGDFKVEKIGDQVPETYLRNVMPEDIVMDSEEIDELTVENASLRFLQGLDVDNLFGNVLSKSGEQTVPGRFSFYRITTDNVETRFINDRDTSELAWIDEPLFFSGNVTFEDLFVGGDVATETLNDLNIDELEENSLNVSATRINDLSVTGNVSWNLPPKTATSLTFLLENAMTNGTNQVINGDTTFENDVSVSKLEIELKDVDEIRAIVEDAVVDDEEVVEVFGQKIFKEDLSIDDLSVTGDVNVAVINNVNVLRFNETVVRKDEDETRITGPVTFLDEVVLNEVIANDSVHDVPLKGLALATDRLPSNVSFKHLIVIRDVYLQNLDGIEFDRFLKDRVSVDGYHEIGSNVQFNGMVEVTGNATVATINGVEPDDLVLDGVAETQVISGTKIFEDDVLVNGNVRAPLINGLDTILEYSNGVRNDEDVEIIGDLIFETEVKVPENVTVSGSVNGVNLRTVLDTLKERSRQTFQRFERDETKMEESIRESSSIAETLKNVFLYLETEERLKIQAPNVKKIDVLYYEGVTKLNMFGEEPGSVCGLPVNCSCPTEYVSELREGDCRIWRTNGTAVVRNYHELHSTFGVNVITSTVSSSRECTSSKLEDEFTTISWMKSGMLETGDVLADVTKTPLKIRGFVKDAEVFMTYDNAAFVVLAIHYDAARAVHRTDSLIYKIDFDANKLSLHQRLETDGAWAVEIFKTNHRDVYLLLGCFGESDNSYLYRLNATTSMFKTLRSFGGKARNAKSLFQEEDHFVLLDDFDTNAVNIFQYLPEFDNFYDYQSLFHDSKVDKIECFYADEFGRSDTFIIVTTENDHFYIYEYMFAQKFQLKIHHRMDDLQAMVPFYYSGNRYIFTGTSTNSTILRIVQQGPH